MHREAESDAGGLQVPSSVTSSDMSKGVSVVISPCDRMVVDLEVVAKPASQASKGGDAMSSHSVLVNLSPTKEVAINLVVDSR